MQMFRLVAIVDPDQLATLLLAARASGVKLDGIEPILDERPSRQSVKRGAKQSTKTGKPKRYKASMQVKLGPEPTDGPPKLIKLHRALKKEYGDAAFRKGDAKAAIRKRMRGYSGGMMTQLLDRGNMLPA